MPIGTAIGLASGKKAPDKPEIPYFDETDYISQSRRMQNLGYRQASKALENVDTLNDDTRNELQNVANQYTQNQWSDLNRNYTKQMNQMQQANYQRFGSTGSTPALYNTESTQRAYNDLASETAAQTAKAYNDLINQEYARRLDNLDAAYDVFTKSGDTAYKHDYNNYLTKIRNTGIQYEKEVADYNKDIAWLKAINKLENTLGGGAAAAWLGPVGGYIGAGIESIDESLLPWATADTRAYGYETSPMLDFGLIQDPKAYAEYAKMINQLGAAYPTPTGWGSNLMSGKMSKGTATGATPSITGGAKSKGYVGTLPKL